MDNQKYIAIGDIHGCAATLEALLDQLDSYHDRLFVFIGDYIDRGPASKEVVDLLIDFQKEANCIFLRGNHEQMMLDALSGGDKNLWLMNGGRTTINSYRHGDERFELSEAHRQFYESTKLYFDTEEYFFVHAGPSPTQTIEESLADDKAIENFLWERSHLNIYDLPWEKKVVFGHTPRNRPIYESKMIGIDTGCVYNRMGYGKLTAVVLPEEEFIQQDRID